MADTGIATATEWNFESFSLKIHFSYIRLCHPIGRYSDRHGKR